MDRIHWLRELSINQYYVFRAFMHVLPVRIEQVRKNDPKITQLSFPCTVSVSASRLHL